MPQESPTLYAATLTNTPLERRNDVWTTDNTNALQVDADTTNRHSISGVIPAEKETDMTKRVVQIYVADPDDSVPLKDSLIYSSGDPEVTDLADEELWFEHAERINAALKTHNEKRVQFEQKDWQGERQKFLEPARIKDISMTVVTIASF